MATIIERLRWDDPAAVDFFVNMSWETERENGLVRVDGSVVEQAKHRDELLGFVEDQTAKAVFCAIEDGQRVGLAWVAATEPGEPWDLSPPYAWIYDVRVDPAHRRRGYAMRLLDSARAWSAEHGFDRIGLHVFDRNRAALALYEAAGFRTRNAYYQRTVGATGSGAASGATMSRVDDLADESRTLIRQRFVALAHALAPAASEAEIDKEYAVYEERFGSRPRTEIRIEARGTERELLGCAWGYASSGDVVADRYVWLRDLCVADVVDAKATMQDLLAGVEEWAVEQGLTAVRVPAHALESVLLQTLDRVGYRPTNRFLFRAV